MKEIESKKNHKWLKRFFFIFFILFIIILILLLYSRFVATKGLIIKEYRIVDSKLSDNFYGIKIAHLSDLHYGTTFSKDDLKELTEKVNLTKPDIIVFTGDLIDKNAKVENSDLEALTEAFQNMNATIGKYAVAGDQDQDRFSVVLSNSNFNILTDTYDLVYKENNIPLLIAGLNSNLKASETIDKRIASTIDYLNSLGEDAIKPSYRILLLHEPDYVGDVDLSYFDLALAGHSNGGLIRIPYLGGLFTSQGAKKYPNAFYQIDHTKLFVSSGIGTTDMKFRFNNRPSFNLYRLVNK